MDEVQDRHCRVARLRQAATDIDITAKSGRKPLPKQRDPASKVMRATHSSDLSRRTADPAMGSRDWIVAIDGKAQRISRASLVQGGNGDGAAAIELPVDRDRRQTRQRAACQHVIGAEHMPVIVEERLGSRPDIHRAKYDAEGARIDPFEIDRFADQDAQFSGGNNRLFVACGNRCMARAVRKKARKR